MGQWDHQPRSVAMVNQAIADGHRRICLTVPTGGGKTRIAQMLIRQFLERRKKASLYTNRRSLVAQTLRSFKADGFEVGVRASEYTDERWLPFQISSIQTETVRLADPLAYRNWQLHEADFVVVDECFVAGTGILTPSGVVDIDKVRCGDRVYCATGVGVVESTSCRPSLETYRLEFSNGTIIECTGDHPIFTGRGWETARTMGVGSLAFSPEAVQILWQDLAALEKGPRKWDRESHERGLVESPRVLWAILREEARQPNEQQSGSHQNAGHDPKAQASTDQERWQWSAASLAAACVAARSGRRVGSGVRGADGGASDERGRPNLLQDRHRKPEPKDRHRGRRGNAPIPVKKGSRREEVEDTVLPRLVRLSRVERKSPVPVFNLRVGGHPSYFANGLLVHNCHLNTGPSVQDILTRHVEQGAVVLGLTATPVDMAGVYDVLLIGATIGELRRAKVTVPFYTFGCDEPDLSKIKVASGEDLSEGKARKAMMTPTIWGRVWDWYCKLNPNRKPALGFAPGVAESIGFAQEFYKRGIRSAHIDGDSIWINGEWYDASTDARGWLFGDEARESALKTGEVQIVWNRYVAREGIDVPCIEHIILATVMGNVKTWLQSLGRGGRASPGKRCCIIQDHGGHTWRAGLVDPNKDREWSLEYTSNIIASMQADAFRDKTEREPGRCPKCSYILTSRTCGVCGFAVGSSKLSRNVVQIDGSLKLIWGDVHKPRRVDEAPDAAKKWKACWERGLRSKMTFKQVEGLYAKDNFWLWPPRDLPFMPRERIDWHRRVCDVPMHRLIPPRSK